MRRIIILLFFVLSACFAQTSEARKLALLIGVDDYATVQPLKCCVNDMNTLKAALMKIGFEENDIQMLVTGGAFRYFPTKENIERRLSELLSSANSSDMVFIAFSGHGAQNGSRVFFCPADAKIDDLNGTCVSITKVMDDIAKCKAKFKWVVVDACRNDPASSRDARGLQIVPAPPAGIALFQSCAEGEKSYEERNGGNGYFTKNFAKALSGEADSDHDGKLTLMEVCKWTTAHTKAEVLEAEKTSQRPYFSGSISDFTLTEDLNVPKAKALVEEARKAMDDENYALAVKKFDEAIALCPRFNSIKRERNYANKMLNLSQKPSVAERPATPSEEPRPSTSAPIQTSSGTLKAGDRKTFTVNGVEFAFRWCPPGKFMMGSPEDEEGRFDTEKPQHQVTLTKGFWMMETEVTQKQWKAVMGKNPRVFKGDDLPVENVSWDDCQKFCKKCTQLGLSVQLPTEVQWEYACRAGSTGAYAGNLDEMAWYNSNSVNKTHPVGMKKPNLWGLYDMHGNVSELSQDSYCDPTNSANCVNRGGSCFNFARYCRSALRRSIAPSIRNGSIGFRVVRGQ